jgi:N-acetylneuraminate synthase (EC 2.5.1.56)
LSNLSDNPIRPKIMFFVLRITIKSLFNLQTEIAETMTIPFTEGEFFISDEKSLWNGQTPYDLYKQTYTPVK